MKCKSCGSILRELQYQSRSADEAQTLVHRCPQCPLDTSKFSRERKKPHLYLKRFPRHRKTTPVVDMKTSSTLTILRITTKSFHSDSSVVRNSARAHNVLDPSFRLFKCYSTGPWAGMAISRTSSKRLTLNAEVIVFDVALLDTPQLDDYNDFEFAETSYGIIVAEGREEVLMRKVQSETDIVVGIQEAYSMGFAPDSLSTYVNGIVLGSMSNMNARAYDAFSADDDQHLFSTKPDGERMWMAKSGMVWFYCRRLLEFKIEAWIVAECVSYTGDTTIGPVLDVETMLGFPPILIDILTDHDASLSPYDRTVDWINSKMVSLIDMFPSLSKIHIRDFFSNRADAELYTRGVPYPVDGLVAISLYGTDMKKLKPTKSMELQMSERGYLVSKEGTKLLKLQNEDEYPCGSIVEIRFSIDQESLRIHNHFRRLDKVSANGDSAISSIVASCMEPESDSVVRTALWRWSNRIRFYMYEKAFTMNSERNIVIDIGSGTGQSSEAFDRMPGCSFILVEPDSRKCRLLAKRLGVRKVHTNPRSLIPEMPALRRLSTRYHVLNCTLQDLLSDQPCVNNLKGTIRCALACFSAQFVIDSVDKMSSMEIPFVGSFYSYNGIKIGDCIVDFAGIRMERASETEAIVKWGSDEMYTEPVVTLDDMPFTVSSIVATDIIGAPMTGIDDTAQRLCSSLKILISK